MKKVSSTRKPNIDFLRTVAILGVIAVHSTGFAYGRFGVQLFFIISGYLLVTRIDDLGRSNFLRGRISRLAPLSILMVIFYFKDNLFSVTTFLNIFLLQNLFYSIASYPGGWSISNEMLFSILLFFAYKQFATYKKTITILLILSITQLFLAVWVAYKGGVGPELASNKQELFIWLNTFNPIGNAAAFIGGVFIRNFGFNLKRNSKIIWIIALIVGFVFDSFVGNLLPLQVFVLLLIFQNLLLVNLPRPLLWLGNFSGSATYGAFFAHFILLDITQRFLSFPPLNTFSCKLLYFLYISASSIIIGKFTYVFIEAPACNAAQKFFKKYN